MIRKKLNITGMTCVNCANAIIKSTCKINGVASANVNLADNSGIFEFESDEIFAQIKTKIKKLGYGVADDFEQLEREQNAYLSELKRKFIVAAILSATIMTGEMFLEANLFVNSVLFALASVVIIYCGASFYKHAISAIKSHNYDMNVLILLGSGSAYFYSLFALIFANLLPENMKYLYFSGASMIITFVLLGKFLEENSKNKARSYIKSLMDLSPKTAWKVLKDGQICEIPISELKIGDIVEIKSGYGVPCDGVIVSGGAEIDSANLNGESLSEYKGIGDRVFAGTINTNGYMNVEVEKTGSDTLLAQILELLLDAGAKKMPIARFADKVANIFVPSVVATAFATFIIWSFFDPLKGILAAICVLIISCPCALGLATPIAIISSISAGAKNGILIKNPQVLEIIKDAKFVVFDKTGTLTKGEISVSQTNLSQESLNLVARTEKLSEHQISRAICKFVSCDEAALDANKFVNSPGLGVNYNEGEILIGSKRLLSNFDVEISKKDSEFASEFTGGVVFVAINKKYEGFIALSDEIKSDAKYVISELKKQQIAQVMLSGDREKTALKVAEQIGIERVIAGVLPNEKYNKINELKRDGITIFVGDGINDAPSIKAADIGIAMNSGSDVSKEIGDIILLRNDLTSVLNTIILAHASMKTIKQNLAWAFLYNIICIPVAAGALYWAFGLLLTPMIGAAAMSVSSVSVVLNSLRLKAIKLPEFAKNLR